MRRALPLALAVALLLGCSSDDDDDSDASAASDASGSETTTTVAGDDAPRAREDIDDVDFDHWHATVDAYRCTGYERSDTPFLDVLGDPVGIHTHNDNVIHIHPFFDEAAGRNARFQHFLDDAAVEITDDSVTFPDGEVWSEADGCDGAPADVALAVWTLAADAEAGNPPDEVITEDIGDTRFTADLQAFVIALVPEGTGAEIPPPDGVALRLGNLTDI